MSEHLEATRMYLEEELGRELPAQVFTIRHSNDVCLYHSGKYHAELITTIKSAAVALNDHECVLFDSVSWLLHDIMFAMVQVEDPPGGTTVTAKLLRYDKPGPVFQSSISNPKLIEGLVEWATTTAYDHAESIYRSLVRFTI